jgi:metal-responsive CopG/Arc/MetJ family transcriptional regulator
MSAWRGEVQEYAHGDECADRSSLIRDALALGGKRTKREVIEEALQEYVLRRKQQEILKLFGTLEYDPDYDYKEQRTRR